MPSSSTNVVPVGTKICKPFLLDVMVFSPESGYKFHVSVERDCTPTADAIWKLVFDLYKVVAGQPDVALVHVSFTSGLMWLTTRAVTPLPMPISRSPSST